MDRSLDPSFHAPLASLVCLDWKRTPLRRHQRAGKGGSRAGVSKPSRSGTEQSDGGPFTSQAWFWPPGQFRAKAPSSHRNVASLLPIPWSVQILPSLQSGIALEDRLGCPSPLFDPGPASGTTPFVAPAVNGPALGRSPALRLILLPGAAAECDVPLRLSVLIPSFPAPSFPFTLRPPLANYDPTDFERTSAAKSERKTFLSVGLRKDGLFSVQVRRIATDSAAPR